MFNVNINKYFNPPYFTKIYIIFNNFFSLSQANSIWNNFDLKQKAMLVSICIMATVCLVLAIIYLIKSRKPDAIISWQNKWTDMNYVTLLEKDTTTNSKIGPVADHYERWNCTSFVIWIFSGKSKLCIYIKNS